jgi:signal recognition particle receptor subunit beta
MLSLATKTDRTLFFDFLPIDLGEIRGMKTRVQLYTVPGQVFYNETRKLVLKGVDGLVFVADSQETMLGANVESFKNLEENLRGHGMKLADMPHVIQFNKRDLPKLSAIEDMNAALNKYNAPFYESVATTGIGVQDTLKAIVKLVLLNLTKKYEPKSASEPVVATAPPVAAAAMASVATAAPAAPATARMSVPVAEAPSTAATQESRRTTIPLSPVETPQVARRSPAPVRQEPRVAAPQPIETMSAFAEEEIDGLVDEVDEVEAPAVAAPAEEGSWMGVRPGDGDDGLSNDATFGSSVPLEDLLADDPPAAASAPKAAPAPERAHVPERSPQGTKAKAPTAPSAAPAPAPRVEARNTVAPSSEHDVTLTDVASDEDLFADPSLEIAHMAPGQTREILVPVMLGEGTSARKFKLAIRLRLDPIE